MPEYIVLRRSVFVEKAVVVADDEEDARRRAAAGEIEDVLDHDPPTRLRGPGGRAWDVGGHPGMRAPFCDCHVSTREADGTGSDTTCAAHLADGRAFECPFDSLSEAAAAEYPCADARPLGDFARRFGRCGPTEIEW